MPTKQKNTQDTEMAALVSPITAADEKVIYFLDKPCKINKINLPYIEQCQLCIIFYKITRNF